jgi:acetyl-CoA C-acetyltransferase
MFDTDEHPKATSLEALAGLRPAFRKDGTVTAGNASGINDGAAALVLARADAADRRAGAPRPGLGYAVAGVAPRVMGYGPIPAVQQLLRAHGACARRFRRDRIERGVCRAGAGGEPWGWGWTRRA